LQLSVLNFQQICLTGNFGIVIQASILGISLKLFESERLPAFTLFTDVCKPYFIYLMNITWNSWKIWHIS